MESTGQVTLVQLGFQAPTVAVVAAVAVLAELPLIGDRTALI